MQTDHWRATCSILKVSLRSEHAGSCSRVRVSSVCLPKAASCVGLGSLVWCLLLALVMRPTATLNWKQQLQSNWEMKRQFWENLREAKSYSEFPQRPWGQEVRFSSWSPAVVFRPVVFPCVLPRRLHSVQFCLQFPVFLFKTFSFIFWEQITQSDIFFIHSSSRIWTSCFNIYPTQMIMFLQTAKLFKLTQLSHQAQILILVIFQIFL